jgi:hypothetical protein
VVPFVVAAGGLLLTTFRQGAPKALAAWVLLGLAPGSGTFLSSAVGQFFTPEYTQAVRTYVDGGGIILPSWRNLAGTVLVSLPVATGANALWPLPPGIEFGWQPAQAFNVQSSWPGLAPLPLVVSPATVTQALWGLAFAGLGLIAFGQTWRRVRSLAAGHPTSWRRRALTIYQARLALLGAAGLTLLAYLASPGPAVFPWTGKRYLVGMLVVVPAVLWPLVRCSPAGRGSLPLHAGLRGLRAGAVALLVGVFAAGMIQTWATVPATQAHWRAQATLVANLQALGATHIYGEYWTCNRVAFQTQEQICCSVINENLRRGLDRYMPYRAQVDAAPHPWYVFPLGSPQDGALAAQLAAGTVPYRVETFAGYHAYQADAPLLARRPPGGSAPALPAVPARPLLPRATAPPAGSPPSGYWTSLR